jgi:ribosomal protein L37AE/L43A
VAGSNKFIDLPSTSTGAPAQSADAAPACPKCRSKNSTTAAKRPTANSYWRCLQCGEVWNPALLSAPRQWWQR